MYVCTVHTYILRTVPLLSFSAMLPLGTSQNALITPCPSYSLAPWCTKYTSTVRSTSTGTSRNAPIRTPVLLWAHCPTDLPRLSEHIQIKWFWYSVPFLDKLTFASRESRFFAFFHLTHLLVTVEACTINRFSIPNSNQITEDHYLPRRSGQIWARNLRRRESASA